MAALGAITKLAQRIAAPGDPIARRYRKALFNPIAFGFGQNSSAPAGAIVPAAQPTTGGGWVPGAQSQTPGSTTKVSG